MGDPEAVDQKGLSGPTDRPRAISPHDPVDHARIALLIERRAEARVNRRSLDRAERISRLAPGGWTGIRDEKSKEILRGRRGIGSGRSRRRFELTERAGGRSADLRVGIGREAGENTRRLDAAAHSDQTHPFQSLVPADPGRPVARRRNGPRERGDDARIASRGVVGQHRLDRGGDLAEMPIEYSRFMSRRTGQRADQRQRCVGIADCPEDEEEGIVAGPRIGMNQKVLRDLDAAAAKIEPRLCLQLRTRIGIRPCVRVLLETLQVERPRGSLQQEDGDSRAYAEDRQHCANSVASRSGDSGRSPARRNAASIPLSAGAAAATSQNLGRPAATAKPRQRPTRRESRTRRSSGLPKLVSLNFASWNRVVPWLRAVDELRRAACADSPTPVRPGVSFEVTLIVHPVVEHADDKDA